MHVADFMPSLQRAIALAREAGLTESAAELESRRTAAYTTSSEFLGEVGEAILRFRAQEGRRLPPEVSSLLHECQREIGMAEVQTGTARGHPADDG